MLSTILPVTGYKSVVRDARTPGHWEQWSAVFDHPIMSAPVKFFLVKSGCSEREYVNLTEAIRPTLTQKSFVILEGDHLFLSDAVRQLGNSIGSDRILTLRQFLHRTIVDAVGPTAEPNFERHFVDQNLVFADQRPNGNTDGVSALAAWVRDAVQIRDDSQRKNMAVILGPAGIGKTTITGKLFHYLCRHQRATTVPLLVNKDCWRSARIGQSLGMPVPQLDDIWQEALRLHYPEAAIGKELLRLGLQYGSIVPIFDGLDELCTVFPDRFYPAETIRAFAETFSKERGGYVLMTSRTSFWEDTIPPPLQRDVLQIDIKPFNRQQRDQYLGVRFEGNVSRRDRANRILDRISARMPSTGPSSEADRDKIGYVPFVVMVAADCADVDTMEAIDKFGPHISDSDPLGSLINLFCNRDEGKIQLPAAVQKSVLEFLASEHGLEFASEAVDQVVALLGHPGSAAGMRTHALLRSEAGVTQFHFPDLAAYLRASVIVEWLLGFEGSIARNEVARGYGAQILEQCVGGKLADSTEWIGNTRGMQFDLATGLVVERSGGTWKAAMRSVRASGGLTARQLGALFLLCISAARRETKGTKKETTEAVKSIFCDNEATISGLHICGTIAKLDLSGVAFDRCVLEDVEFSECNFDARSQWVACALEGSLGFEDCRGVEELKIDSTTTTSVIAAEALRREKLLARDNVLTESDIRELALYILNRFFEKGRFIDISKEGVRSWAQKRSAVGDTVLDELLGAGVLKLVSGNRRIAVEDQGASRKLIEERLAIGRVRNALEKLGRKLKAKRQ